MQKFLFSVKALPVVFLATTILLLSFSNQANAQVSMSITASVNANVNTGFFTSIGFTSSSGSFLESYSFNGKKVHSEVTFTFADGTITAKTHSDVVFTGPTTATGTGTWKISKGTGVYENIKGSGGLTYALTGVGTSSEMITQEWSGSLD